MVCAKCQKLSQKTELATPSVKRKNDIYHGSPASTAARSSDKSKTSATLGNNGVGKASRHQYLSSHSNISGYSITKRLLTNCFRQQSKLLSKSAKNPYAAYASSCSTCKTKTEQGRKFCQRCAYRANACAMCGKGLSKEKSTDGAPVVQGQKFSAK